MSQRTQWPWVVLALGVVSVAILVYPLREAMRTAWPGLSRAAFLAIPIYASSHLLRVVRLMVLLSNENLSIRGIALAHLSSAAAGFLPLKVGEGVRILALGKVNGGNWNALRTIWIERTFDAAAIAIVGLFAWNLTSTWLAWWVALLWLATTALTLLVLPDNLRLTKRWLIRRYTTDWLLRVLPSLHRLVIELDRGRQHIRGKIPTLVLLTVCIWGAEILAISLVIDGTGPDKTSLIAALSTSLLPADSSTLAALAVHHTFTAITALLLGAFAVPILGHRWRSS